MNKRVRWLDSELGVWLERGIITPAQAENIRALYPEAKAPPWGLLIFSGLGAVVGGFGVILLLAYNWQEIPKFGKLGLIFLALAGFHAAGLRWLRETDWKRQLGEALCLLGTMLFGAGIWLVAQIYHIEERYANGFLAWALGALAVAWAMDSVAHGLLAAVLVTIWAGSEAFGFNTPVHWAPALLAVGIGWLAWRKRSVLLLAATVPGFYLVVLFNASQADGVFAAALNVAVFLVAAGFLAERFAAPEKFAPVLKFFGWTTFVVCLYLLTFPGLHDGLLNWHARSVTDRQGLETRLYVWISLTLALAIWAWCAVLARKWPRQEGRIGPEAWLAPGVALVAQALAVQGASKGGWLLGGVFNVAFLALAGMWMARGCREGLLGPTVCGSLLLVALMTARYFDAFESLAARGLAFLLVGGVLFAEGFFYRRARQRAASQKADT
jgi:uncharacterized membrane protein